MSREIVFRGEVPFLRVLDESGRVDPVDCPDLPDPDVVGLYEAMVLTRTLDNRAVLLQREGRIGTYAQSLGQEAAQVGSAFALAPMDWVVPSYRENAVLICRGIPMQNILLYWAGDERGMLGFKAKHCLPYAIPVGTQLPHACGMAIANRLRGSQAIVACYFGDGATSTGDFHEALTMAGSFRARVVFICQNTGGAISGPRSRQCAAPTLAQKGLGYGVEAIQVDGNDVLACYAATKEAVDRARAGGGPTLIEAVTYRLGDHTTADDASRYRDATEVEAWAKRDPLLRLRLYLEARGLWDAGRDTQLSVDCERRVDSAVRAAEGVTPPNPEDVVRYTYANPVPPATSNSIGRDGKRAA